MKHKNSISILIALIVVLSATASSMGIFSAAGSGPYEYESIRGETVEIYGKGIYQHMSAEVAPQGIAQDYVTLFIAIPLLLVSFYFAQKGLLKGYFMLAGTLGYFLVTYLFYLVMAMFNILFLVYAMLLCVSFFAFSLTLLSFDLDRLPDRFTESTPVKTAGGFLIFNSVAIAFLWLGVVVPPLLDGSVIPAEVEHYTTLVVQGLDLGLLLPLAFLSGWLFIKKKPFGYLLAPTYLIFLSILMTALVAKIAAMGLLGQNIIPVVFIIPAILVFSILCAVLTLNNIKE